MSLQTRSTPLHFGALIAALPTALAAALLALPIARTAESQQAFAPFGARSLALGGATVALDDGAATLADNPAVAAGVALRGAISVGGLATESGDFLDPLKTLSGLDPDALASGVRPDDVTRARTALGTLSDPGNGLLGTGQQFSSAAISRGWGISYTKPTWTGAFTRADLVHVATGDDPATSFRNNTSVAAYRGLTIKDLGISKAVEYFGGRLALGITVHWLRGTTFSKEESAFTTDVSEPFPLARRGITGNERTRTRFTWDAGGVIALGPVRLAGVVKAINRPTFPFADDGPVADRGVGVTYGRQARVGAAVHLPVVGITVTADFDVSKNDTMVDGLKSRMLGGGVEWRLAILALRGGLAVNLESPDKTKFFSAGLGVVAGPARLDAAAVYRPNGALGAMLTLRTGI